MLLYRTVEVSPQDDSATAYALRDAIFVKSARDMPMLNMLQFSWCPLTSSNRPCVFLSKFSSLCSFVISSISIVPKCTLTATRNSSDHVSFKYRFAWKPVLVPVLNPDVPLVSSFLFLDFISLPARCRALECSILHFHRCIALIQSFRLRLSRSFASTCSISIKLCLWCDVQVVVSPYLNVDGSHLRFL